MNVTKLPGSSKPKASTIFHRQYLVEGARDKADARMAVFEALQDIADIEFCEEQLQVHSLDEDGLFRVDVVTDLPDEIYWKEEKPNEEEVFNFLDSLRESGITNMFGAASYLIEAFNLDRRTARAFLSMWMHSFSERQEAKNE